MDVTLLYFKDCPNWKVADERLSVPTSGERPSRARRPALPHLKRTSSSSIDITTGSGITAPSSSIR